MKLTEKAEVVNWEPMHYIFVEKIGPFQETAQKAWQELGQQMAELQAAFQVTGAMALYQVRPQMIYRAGVRVAKKPEKLPDGFKYIHFEGGKYSKYTLTGPYSLLPDASGKVFEYFEKSGAQQRPDFYIENYANDPTTTPEDQLITEILVPTK